MFPFFLTPYRGFLLGLTILFLAASLIDPPWPQEQILQHIPTLIGLGLLIWGGKRVPLSDGAFTCLVLFLLLHIIGARWIYSFVPYDDWFRWLTGRSISELFGFRRNHYDRLVHFAYGLLFVLPFRELLERRGKLRPLLARWLAVELVMGTSMLYELIEWLIAVVLSPGAAEAYNGQQGDMWDAQKDMALAMAGAVLAATAAAIRSRGKKSS